MMKTVPTPKLAQTFRMRALGFFMLGAALCPTVYADDALGRLFFTPERRQALDRQRQFNIEERQEIPEDPTLTINGVVTRSSGKRTVWINGVAQNDNEKPAGISATPIKQAPGRLVVKTSESTATNARVGETVNRATGESSSLLGEGQIMIHRADKASSSQNRK